MSWKTGYAVEHALKEVWGDPSLFLTYCLLFSPIFFRYWCLTMLVLDHFMWTFAAFRCQGCARPLAGEAKGFCETCSTLETSVVKLGSSNMESLLIQPALPGFSRTAAFWTPCKAVRDGRFPTFCACHWRETTTHLWHRSQWFKCSYITRSCSVLQRCSFFVHDMYWHVLTTLCIPYCWRMPRDPREKPKSLGLNGQHVLEAQILLESQSPYPPAALWHKLCGLWWCDARTSGSSFAPSILQLCGKQIQMFPGCILKGMLAHPKEPVSMKPKHWLMADGWHENGLDQINKDRTVLLLAPGRASHLCWRDWASKRSPSHRWLLFWGMACVMPICACLVQVVQPISFLFLVNVTM